MNTAPKNPFSSALATEQIEPDAFVEYFSDAIVKNAVGFFDLGNVVVKGTPGSGKSMLLTLLKPETRIAYFRHGLSFPVVGDEARFISGGINLTRAGAHDFANRLARDSRRGVPYDDLVLLFADFFNYFVCLDLLRSIKVLGASDLEPLRKEIGLNVQVDVLDSFAVAVSKYHCWFGYLDDVTDYMSLVAKVERRLLEYRSYFNFNVDELSPVFFSSKTSVGEPIAAMSTALRRAGVLSADTKVFIRVDQLEELYSLEQEHRLGDSYRQVINKALGMRDPRMAYRLGTRDYAWERQPAIFGTSSKLEQNRDYTVVSLEDMLRRKENSKGWLFPELARDIFARRLARSGYSTGQTGKALEHVLGSSPPREDLARRYLRGNPRSGGGGVRDAIDLSGLSEEVAGAIIDVAIEDPLDAQLGNAWVRQKSQSKLTSEALAHGVRERLWRKRPWWVKERKEIALLHLAGKMNQRLMWGGASDVVELAGHNALVFISICRHIWQVAIRTDSRSLIKKGPISIDFETQATGIYDASRAWAEKQIPRGMRGDERLRLVSALGAHFRRTLIGDRAMSNPGKNGISLTLDTLANKPKMEKLLAFASDFGDLMHSPHTTKLQDQKPRRKWYLAPILSPYFRIPHVHTKEPIYLNGDELELILGCAPLVTTEEELVDSNDSSKQLRLFSE